MFFKVVENGGGSERKAKKKALSKYLKGGVRVIVVTLQMLYKEVQSYQTHLNNEDCVIVLDLTKLNHRLVQGHFQKFAKGKEENKVRHSFEDALLSVKCLNQKLGAIIVPEDCLYRQFTTFQEEYSQHKNPITPFQYLCENYGSDLDLGVKIQLTRSQQSLKRIKNVGIQRVKIYSFDLSEKYLDTQLNYLKKTVRTIMQFDIKVIFHLDLVIQSVEGLKRLKKYMIQQSFPVQRCYLQTNLLNIIINTFSLDVKADWEEIALKYCEAIKKYVISTVGCLIESYEITSQQQCSQPQQNGLCQTLSLINRRKEESKEKENKRFHNCGVSITTPDLLRLALRFEYSQQGFCRTRDNFDTVCLSKTKDISIGRYKSQVQSFQ